MLHAPYMTLLDVTGNTFDNTAGAWPQHVKFLPGHLFSHLGFPSVCVVLSMICVPSFVKIVDCGLSDEVWRRETFTLPWHLFSHLGFPSVRVVFSVIFIPGFVLIMDYWYLINGWRTVISSLILYIQTLNSCMQNSLNIVILYRYSSVVWAMPQHRS